MQSDNQGTAQKIKGMQPDELMYQVVEYQRKCRQHAEVIQELREDLNDAVLMNEILLEKSRVGIKRAQIFMRDCQGKMSDQGIPCIVEIQGEIATGTSRTAHMYSILSEEVGSQPIASLQHFKSGVIKYYSPVDYATNEQLVNADCRKIWYLSDLANEYNNACGLRLISFVECAKIKLDNGQFCAIEIYLDDFDKACDNDGEGWDDLDDRLSSFAHYVFEKSQHKYLPCDFQGDLSRMILTDPAINSCTETEEFDGISTRGKAGTWNCLGKHLLTCKQNKFCNYLNLNDA